MLSKINSKLTTKNTKIIWKKILIPIIALCVFQILNIWNIWIKDAQADNNSVRIKDKQNKELQNKWKSEISFMNDILSNKIQPNKENQSKWIKSKKFLINNLDTNEKELQQSIIMQIFKADSIMKIEYFFKQ